jgi:alpha-tubulin suppressor-like RCC1 family protein
MKWAKVAAAVVFLAPLVACDDTGPNISGVPGYSISAVRMLPNEMTIFIPDTVRESDHVTFEAVGLGKGGALLTNLRFAWETSDPSIATVDENGTVTPVRAGTVKIMASAHKVGEATLVILPATEVVTVSPALDSIFVDEPLLATRDFKKLEAKATDFLGRPLTGVAFTWQAAAANVAAVDVDGTVRATGLGTTSVTVTANGGAQATASMRIVPIVASAQLINAPSQVLALDNIQLVAEARNYSNALIARRFNWTSSNPSVATVDTLGRLKVLTTGQTTITARSAFRTASIAMTALERELISVDGGEDFTCGFTNLGRGYCWGLADLGQTGVEPDSSCSGSLGGFESCILLPKRMNEPQLSFTTISAGGDFACGVTTDRLLYCWGNDEVGQIGNGLDGAGTTPKLATVKSERFTTVSAGLHHACALNLNGRVFCWGSDSDGQLGDDRTIHSTTPIPVADSTLRFTMISAGDNHTCGLSNTGAAYCWGRGEEGQIGNGGMFSQEVPTAVTGGVFFTSIAAGGSHTCGVSTSGAIYCWGSNENGQLGSGGQGSTISNPVIVIGPDDFTAVTAGENHTCGIAGGGQVYCWGGSEYGELGDGNTSHHSTGSPFVVSGFTASAISAGANHTCAISTAGGAWCWGSNRWGALGNEFQAAIRATPQRVATPR